MAETETRGLPWGAATVRPVSRRAVRRMRGVVRPFAVLLGQPSRQPRARSRAGAWTRTPTSSDAAAMTHRGRRDQDQTRTLGLVRLRKSCARARSAGLGAGLGARVGRRGATAHRHDAHGAGRWRQPWPRVMFSLVRCIPFPSRFCVVAHSLRLS